MEGDSEVGAFSSSAAALDNSKVENDNDEIKRCIEDMVERLASGWVDQESTMDAAGNKFLVLEFVMRIFFKMINTSILSPTSSRISRM